LQERGSNLYIQTDRDAELNAADQMQLLGYADARAMPVGADGGIDVFSKHALAQVKFKQSAAGRPDLQRLYGARGDQMHKHLVFFSLSGYSQPAIDYANTHHIFLYAYKLSGAIIPQNEIARERLKMAHQTHGKPNQLAAITELKQRKESGAVIGGGLILSLVGLFLAKTAVQTAIEEPVFWFVVLAVFLVILEVLFIGIVVSEVRKRWF
jgi:hypothetical protein